MNNANGLKKYVDDLTELGFYPSAITTSNRETGVTVVTVQFVVSTYHLIELERKEKENESKK